MYGAARVQIPGALGPTTPRSPSAPAAPGPGPDPAASCDTYQRAETLSRESGVFLSDRVPELGPARLPSEAPPRLERPVLFLHGYMGWAEEFDGMVRWLERDGTNRSGGILDGAHPGPVDPSANVFALRFGKQWQSLEADARELRAAVEAICQATGAPGVDVVAHSKGGLDVRLYLMDPTEKVDHVVQIGTPNQGTFLANLELVARERFGYPVRPPSKDPEVAATLRQLTVDGVDGDGKPRNPALHDLNAGWETQKERAEFLTISGDGIPTITHRLPGVTPLGDGVVTRRSAGREDVPARHVWFRPHGQLLRSPVVMREVAAFLVDQPTGNGTEIFETAEDRERAKALGLLGEADGYLVSEPPR